MNDNIHDLQMLHESNLFNQLRTLMAEHSYVLSLYEDPAYHQSIYIIGRYHNTL